MPTNFFSRIPLVRDGNDLPFVVGISDGTPFHEIDGVELRRGPSTCYFSVPVHQRLRLNTILQADGGKWFLIASAGPLLVEWWSLIAYGNPIPDCPLLTKAGAGAALTLRTGQVDIPVQVMSLPDPASIVVVFGRTGDIDDEAISIGLSLSPALCMVALTLLLEYRKLVGEVPDIDVALGDGTFPLSALLDFAEQVVPSLPGELRP